MPIIEYHHPVAFVLPPIMMMASTLNVKAVPCNVALVPTQPNARHVQSIVILRQVVVAVRDITTTLITCARIASTNV